MIEKEIRERLLKEKDGKFQKFNASLIPNVESEKIIGIKTPVLKNLAKEYAKNPSISRFLKDLPHLYFEENNLHAFIIAEEKDFEKGILKVEEFLPFVNNWATCDQLIPRSFKKDPKRLLPYIKKWLISPREYTVRFSVGLLMRYFLDENFKTEYLQWVSAVKREEYYIKMMVAWFFATALAKRYGETLPFLENKDLDKWTHNKTIQKAVESFRISKEQKEYLKTLKY